MTPIEDDGEVEISDKMLEDTEISRDSGLGDISENMGEFDLSEYLEAAWQAEVGPLYSDNQSQQPFNPPPPPAPAEDSTTAGLIEAECREDRLDTEEVTDDVEEDRTDERTEDLYSCDEREETVPSC